MANKDLFKQAIAEAKSVREAAIANAKEALEETLTPHLKDMLAAKLQEMEDSSIEEELVAEEVSEEVVAEAATVEEVEEGNHSDEDEAMEEAVTEAEDEAEEAADEAEEEPADDEDLSDLSVEEFKDLIRDIISQEMGHEDGEEEIEAPADMDAGEEMPEEPSMEEPAEDEEEIDLDELLAELENTSGEAEAVNEETVEEGIEEEELEEGMMDKLKAIYNDPEVLGKLITVDGKKMSLKDFLAMAGGAANQGQAQSGAGKTSSLGEGEDELNEAPATDLLDLVQNLDPTQIGMLASYIGGLGGAVAAKLKASDYCAANPDNKICKAWKGFSQDAGQAIRNKKAAQGFEEGVELNEALETIESLKADLTETNLLNSKLLYVNKIFKANSLSESQKVNVIAAFDKAETVKEVKLVYETVCENVVATKKTTVKEHKGMASKATGTTASKPEVISEVSSAVRRMQELAGIL